MDQPGEGATNFAHKVKIKSFPVRLYLGVVFAYLGEGEPPEFQELHALHGDGVLQTNSYVRKTNFFNSLDNSADWVHENFVHARSAYKSSGINREVPSVTAEETDFGLAGYCKYSDGVVGVNYILMPICMSIVSPHEGKDGEINLGINFAWRVPLDDYTHRSFNLQYVDVTGERAQRFRDSIQARRDALAALPSRDSVVEAIYRGEVHVDEVDEARPDLLGIQDRSRWRCNGRSASGNPTDSARPTTAVILLRRIYMGEVRQMLDGQPMKAWVWPPDIRPVRASRGLAAGRRLPRSSGEDVELLRREFEPNVVVA